MLGISIIDIMHEVTSALQTPVILLLLILVVVMVVIVGMLIAEFFTERRFFKLSVPQLVDQLQASSDPEAVIRESGMLRRQKNVLFELLSHPQASELERESMAVNIAAQERAVFDNRIKVTDLISKVSPMLGLMGTLIPLGPGVVAIGQGETETLSQSLLIAFDTTIFGLLVAAVALLVSAIRKSWYAKYNAAFEAACEVVLDKANHGAFIVRPAEGVPSAAGEAFGQAGSGATPVAGRGAVPSANIGAEPAAGSVSYSSEGATQSIPVASVNVQVGTND